MPDNFDATLISAASQRRAYRLDVARREGLLEITGLRANMSL